MDWIMDKRYIDKCYMADAVTGQQAGRPAPEAGEADGAESPAQPVQSGFVPLRSASPSFSPLIAGRFLTVY